MMKLIVAMGVGILIGTAGILAASGGYVPLRDMSQLDRIEALLCLQQYPHGVLQQYPHGVPKPAYTPRIDHRTDRPSFLRVLRTSCAEYVGWKNVDSDLTNVLKKFRNLE